MGQSCIDVDADQLDHMVRMLRMVGISVAGSQQADGVVETVTGSIYSQITARCVPCRA